MLASVRRLVSRSLALQLGASFPQIFPASADARHQLGSVRAIVLITEANFFDEFGCEPRKRFALQRHTAKP